MAFSLHPFPVSSHYVAFAETLGLGVLSPCPTWQAPVSEKKAPLLSQVISQACHAEPGLLDDHPCSCLDTSPPAELGNDAT